FYLQNGELQWEKNPEILQPTPYKNTLWIDLQAPTDEEMQRVETEFGIEFFTPQEAAEIESSSRYFEDSTGYEANSAFVVVENGSYITRQISFILKDNILFTSRRTEMKAFAETVRKMKTFKSTTT